MEIDPPNYDAHGKVTRGDAEKRAREAAKSVEANGIAQGMAGWARKVLGEKASVNRSANLPSNRPAQNFGKISVPPPSSTPPSALPALPQKQSTRTNPELPDIPNSAKYYSLHWVPGSGNGLKWIEVPDTSLNYVLTYQADSDDGFVYEEITDCDAPPPEE